MDTKNFGLIGAAGYVAPRHMRAIKENNCNLIAVFDPNDSVGIIDSYFPNSSFFTEIERFDRHLDRLKRRGNKIDYISICSPNYLHDAHMRFALRNGCNAICEKPLVTNYQNLFYLEQLEKETLRKINCILQLRLHPSVVDLKRNLTNKIYDVDLKYITSRGTWYKYSWKGDYSKSGGLAMNIGVHFFDLLIFLFGDFLEYHVKTNDESTKSGYIRFEKANVNWKLSVDYNQLPEEVKANNKRTFRNITIDKNKFEFSGGFEDLHTLSYRKILDGEGFTIEDCKQSIKLSNLIGGI
tara:strand:+ start:1096 stop:1983 length:888 start_codon:yes stop_codon:yes gene_type:complete